MEALRVGLMVGSGNVGGAPTRYFHNLVRHLQNDDRIEAIVYCRGDPKDVFGPDTDGRQLPDKSIPPRWHTKINADELDLLHLGCNELFGEYPAYRTDVPVVATSHGVEHWNTELPDEVNVSGRLKWRLRIQDVLRALTLDRVFCVSEYVAETLRSQIPFGNSRLRATYEAIDDVYYTLPKQNRPEGAPEQYMLHVATDPGIKNTETAIKAAQSCAADLPLYIAGVTREDLPASTSGNVHTLGFLKPSELVTWYDNAACLIHPSFHETFGRPIVEAMTRKTPVVASDLCAIPEISNGAALLINDPTDVPKFADALDKIVSDEMVRSELVKKGEKQANKFTWENHLNTIISEYRGLHAEQS
ncbi:glycosyltransferase family 4 protein [Natronomonas halophila]|uniref:glycosyltransferase family 4 protein n=1 Tax=Natronomonas halophila TaxID=2747817 RepID=UPI0015B5799A|nr:glycosyltransferase family 1 protein [Natronomonas halophila]QLD84602.1 glycosyltransferase family 4 protein [Natronomonas halophila]QLD84658.1 glycosyltransferase family 4 protein [Natronomonas halophila]